MGRRPSASPPLLRSRCWRGAAAAHGLTAPLLDAFNSGSVVAACIGPVCAEGARAAGIEKPLVPEHPRLGSLTNALAGYLAQHHLRD